MTSEPRGSCASRIATISADEPEFTITPYFLPMNSATRASNSWTFLPGISPSGSCICAITALISVWSNMAPP